MVCLASIVYGMAWRQGMVYGMAWWARHDIWYSLAAMACYTLWSSGHHMVYGMAWRTSHGTWYGQARYVMVCGNHHHHHHHIHFRALFSSTEGWAFWQVFLEGVLSTQNGSEGQQNPYLASFCHSQALHPMISLICQIFSVQPHSACVLLQSSLCCALHVQTISSYWCGAPHLSFVRRESELTSSFALTLQIQRIMARSLRQRRFSVSTFMAQVSAACSITLLTHEEYTLPLVRRGRWRLVRRGRNWRNLPHAHLQRVKGIYIYVV